MPEILNAGVKIHYSVQGEGPPLLLHHGSGSNGAAWIQLGYARALREQHRLILIDARGHGQSDKPYAPEAHSLEARVSDVIAVLDALELSAVHFLGYSMGGWIGFGLAALAPARLRSLAVGGAHPFLDSVTAQLDPDATEPDRFIEAMELVLGEPVPTETRQFLLRNDSRAVLASLRERVPLDDVLRRIEVPCFLFAGSDDRRHHLVKRAAAEISGARFVSLPGRGHLGALAHSNEVLPHLQRFLRGLYASAQAREGS
jgi:pimeloyl-ACP methyl ester carboxylesterase